MRGEPTGNPTRAGGARRSQIVHIATRLFAEHGYRAVGMRAIAEAASVRTSTLYYHFASKEEILQEIGIHVTQDCIDDNTELLHGDLPVSQRLAAFVRQHVLYFHDHRLEEAVAKRELREMSDEARREVLIHMRSYRRLVEGLIEEGIAAGEFDAAEPQILATAMLDMLNGITSWFSVDGRLSIEELADLYVALCSRLLGITPDASTK